MSALPPNWTRYTTDEGKEYFHNSVSNLTQWEKPAWPEADNSGPSFTSEVYQYKPSETELMSTSSSANQAGAQASSFGFVTSGAGDLPTLTESDTVSLRQNGVTGQMSNLSSSQQAAPAPGGGGEGFGIASVISAATSEDGPGVSGYSERMVAYAQTFFDVNDADVVKRLKAAVLPFEAAQAFGGGAMSDFRQRPDFWGPFWVATTAVLFLAATGNFARLLEAGTHKNFKADYSLVSIAASMVYGCLVGVPVLTRGALWMSGQEADSINFRQMICVYGYSLTSAIPVSILCLAPLSGLRSLAVLVGLAVAILFIRSNLWSDIAVEAPRLKWTLVALLCGSQVVIFGVYRFHFFSSPTAVI
jgi:hypothetical protein